MSGEKVSEKSEVSPLGELLGTEVGTEIGSSGGFSGGINDGKREGSWHGETVSCKIPSMNFKCSF